MVIQPQRGLTSIAPGFTPAFLKRPIDEKTEAQITQSEYPQRSQSDIWHLLLGFNLCGSQRAFYSAVSAIKGTCLRPR